MDRSDKSNNELMALLTAVIEQLTNLSPAAVEWEMVVKFVAEVQAEIEARDRQLVELEEIKAAHRAKLTAQLDALCQETSDLLVFFGFMGCDTGWQLDEIPDDAIDPIILQAETLLGLLREYEQVRTEAETSVFAKKRLQSALDEYEVHILKRIEDLQKRLFGEADLNDTKKTGAFRKPTAFIGDLSLDDESPVVAFEEWVGEESVTDVSEEPTEELSDDPPASVENVEEDGWGVETVVIATTDDLSTDGSDGETVEDTSIERLDDVVAATDEEGTAVEENKEEGDDGKTFSADEDADLSGDALNKPDEKTVVEITIETTVDEEGYDPLDLIEEIESDADFAYEDNEIFDNTPDSAKERVVDTRTRSTIQFTPEQGIEDTDTAFHEKEETDIAVDALETEMVVDLTSEQWQTFFWQLILEGDIAGAYWVNRLLAAREDPVFIPIPDWLVAAVQGSWWLRTTRGQLVQDMGTFAFKETLGSSANERLMAMSAALLPTLTVPSTGLGTWLETDIRLPEPVNKIVMAVKEFNFYSQPLRRDDVRVIRGEDRRQQTIEEYQQQAKRWIEEAPQRRAPSLKRASDVWYTWSRPGGKLRQMMEIVSNGRKTSAKQLSALIADWRAQSIFTQINQTDALNMKRSRIQNQIVGAPRNWLVNQSEETVQMAEEWLELVTIDEDKASWFIEQVEQLVHTIETEKEAALQGLTSLEHSTSREIEPGVVRLLYWALLDLCHYLELDTEGFIPTARSLPVFPQGIEQDLASGLNYRMYYVPEANIIHDPETTPKKFGQVANILFLTHGKRDVAEIMHQFIERQDYRCLPALIQNEKTLNELSYIQALNKSKTRLAKNLQATRNAIEQSVVEGVLDEDERASYEAQLIDIEQKEDIQNYGGLLTRLSRIRQSLQKQRAFHLNHQQERWTNIQIRLKEKQIRPGIYRKLAKEMEDVLQKEDIIVSDERLARLEEILDSGNVPEKDEFAIQPERDIYLEFVNALEYWETQFKNINIQTIGRNMKMGRRDHVLQFEHALAKPREIEVGEAFEKWAQLKSGKSQGQDRSAIVDSITTILRYLGFTFRKRNLSGAIHWKPDGHDYVYLSVEMTAGNLSPVPQFGSQQEHGFDVICLWERPGAEVIGSRLHNLKLSFNNVLVLYLGRLTKLHRIRLQHFNREQGLSMAVLDELLLLFLARETDARLGAFLNCSLPLASVNPYAETGPVFPEMFVNRVRERKSLQEQSGFAIVYGGRQLGKSAMLQQVKREFHNPANEQFAYLEDIKFVGDPLGGESGPDILWHHLRRGLENMNLLPASTATKAETIIQQIREMMRQNPNRRVLVLFDEADNFLAADMARQFVIVSKIKALMDETQRRFKVIFAGLHDVQRYIGVPNQPLAQLPDLQVGPLDPQSAIQLIRQPLSALGFRFPSNDDTPLLSILAYTNYHPGLIQLFCQKLLTKMYQERPHELGPYIITKEYVEAIYRQEDVQDGIKRRFEWTLALDERYKALAQLLVLDQIEAKDGFSRAYGLDDLLELARTYWPEAFDGSTRDEFRGYLDEMKGLGVLVRNQAGQYRLRSPNLVRLLGSRDDLWGALSELTSKPVSRTLVDESHHAPLDVRAMQYSPFTYQQSRVLDARRFGVGVIFGSVALNINLVSNAIESHFIPEGGSGLVRQMRLASSSGMAVSQWLEDALNRYADREQIVVYSHIQGTPETLREQVETAIEFCAKRLRSRNRWMRVLFVFNETASYQWMQLPLNVRLNIENQIDAIVSLSPWDDIGLNQRLHQHEKIGPDKTIKQVMEALHGWPILLDKLAERWQGSNDPGPVSQALHEEVTTQGSELADWFLSSTGVYVDDKIHQVLKAIAIEKNGFPLDMLVPALLGDKLTVRDCEAITEYCLRLNLLYRRGDEVFIDPLLQKLVA